jgi:hypothetical protein
MSALLPSWARVGAKVVCVGRKRKPGEPSIIRDLGIRWKPKKGAVYTISGTFVDRTYGGFLFLSEHSEPQGFHFEGFRPLVDDEAQERDAAMFRKLLTTRQPVGEDA